MAGDLQAARQGRTRAARRRSTTWPGSRSKATTSTTTISSPAISTRSTWRAPASWRPSRTPRPSCVPLIETSTDSEEIPVEKIEGMPDVDGAAGQLQARRQAPGAGGARHRPRRDRLPRRPAEGPGSEKGRHARQHRSRQAGRRRQTAGDSADQGGEAADQRDRGRRHRHPRRPLLGADPELLRPAGGDPLREQWRLRRQRDRGAGGRQRPHQLTQPRHRGAALRGGERDPARRPRRATAPTRRRSRTSSRRPRTRSRISSRTRRARSPSPPRRARRSTISAAR